MAPKVGVAGVAPEVGEKAPLCTPLCTPLKGGVRSSEVGCTKTGLWTYALTGSWGHSILT